MEPPPALANERVLVYRKMKPAANNPFLPPPATATSATAPLSLLPTTYASSAPLAATMSANLPPVVPVQLAASSSGPAFASDATQLEQEFYRVVDQLLAENSQREAVRRNEFLRKEVEFSRGGGGGGGSQRPASASLTRLTPLPTAMQTMSLNDAGVRAGAVGAPANEAQGRVMAFLEEEKRARNRAWRDIALRLNEWVEQHLTDPDERQRILAEALQRCREQTAEEEEEEFRRAVLKIHDTRPALEGFQFKPVERVAWNANRWFSDVEQRNKFLAWDIEQIRKNGK